MFNQDIGNFISFVSLTYFQLLFRSANPNVKRNIIDEISSDLTYNSSKHLSSKLKSTDVCQSPCQTFPKSNKHDQKNKRRSVQICEDPSHLDNTKELKCSYKTMTAPLNSIANTKGEVFESTISSQ